MDKKFKVFGIGLNKTGTTSLRHALVQLGYDHCEIRGQMTTQFMRGNVAEVLNATEAYESFEDWPWPLMYKEVFARYGDRARYILTYRRSSEVWVESLKAHALETSPDKNPREKIFGYAYPHGVEALHMAFYEVHLAEVRAFFADAGASDLLCEMCLEAGDGWHKLGEFLGETVPSGAFPHANPRANTKENVQRRAENQARIAAQIANLNR